MPDNIASPSYEAVVRPHIEAAGGAYGLGPLVIGPTMLSAVMEGSSPTTTTGQYAIDTGSLNVYGETTFVIQMFVRDYTSMSVRYRGLRYINHPELGQLDPIPHSLTIGEPCCPSGCRMIAMTASGVLLGPPLPVDECLGGIPLV